MDDSTAALPADWFDSTLGWISMFIEAAGVAVIVAGILVAFVTAALGMTRNRSYDDIYRGFRIRLARGILLGLEFLVAGDIIGTVAVEPSLQNLAVLAGIVLIRTFLSFSLQLEIEGRLPWQQTRSEPGAR
jgi:uncharacterized membrane protein